MPIWNRKDGCLKIGKKYYFQGDKIPDGKLNKERLEKYIAKGFIDGVSISVKSEKSKPDFKTDVEMSKGKKGKDK